MSFCGGVHTSQYFSKLVPYGTVGPRYRIGGVVWGRVSNSGIMGVSAAPQRPSNGSPLFAIVAEKQVEVGVKLVVELIVIEVIAVEKAVQRQVIEVIGQERV